MIINLTDDDEVALCSLKHKRQHIEDALVSLARGLDTALFLWGEGGCSKSYTCERQLKRLSVPYTLHNSRMTGRGLVDALQQSPAHIHWIEDAETLLDDKRAIGVLRSACWSQSRANPKVRPITWRSHHATIRFDFTGGILVVSNASMVDRAPEIRALQTRVRMLRMDVSPAEILALTKTICQDGYRVGQFAMSPQECWSVAQFVFSNLSSLNRPPDIRLTLLGFHDFVLARDHIASLSWQELVLSRMAGSPTRYKTPREKAADEKQLALTIYAKPISQAEKIREWKEKSGKNRASFYNAMKR